VNDRQAEIFRLIYALGDAIEKKDWITAHTLWERLLETYSPLREMYAAEADCILRNAVEDWFTTLVH
jgi:hypothetical protein